MCEITKTGAKKTVKISSRMDRRNKSFLIFLLGSIFQFINGHTTVEVIGISLKNENYDEDVNATVWSLDENDWMKKINGMRVKY